MRIKDEEDDLSIGVYETAIAQILRSTGIEQGDRFVGFSSSNPLLPRL